MGLERKTTMISGRVPVELLARVDAVTRNTESQNTANRSAALRTALEAWLPGQERQIEDKLGVSKKAR